MIRKGWSTLKKLMFLSGALAGDSWNTVTGAVAVFVATAAKPVKVSFTLKPVQSGSGDPSPENVRAISGHDSATLKHSGEDTSDYDSHTATFPSTVYGGEVDWNAGKLKVTHAIIDIGTLSWVDTTASSHTVFRSNPTGMLNVGSSRNTNGCCSHYKMATNASDLTCFFYEKAVYVRDDSYERADAFKTAITGENCYLCYPLATPTEVSLSDLDSIVSIIGENSIWVDESDSVTVVYWGLPDE